MQDQTTAADTDANEDDAEDERSLLIQRAKMLNIKFSPTIGTDTLRARVNAAVTGEAPPADDEDEEAAQEQAPAAAAEAPAAVPVAASVASNRPKTAQQIRDELYREEMRLIRLRITNLNPTKKDLEGDFYCVANRFLGIVKKYVPFGEVTDNGYHVPNVIYKQLLDAKFLQVKVKKDPSNSQKEIVTQRWVSEFALEVLPQLTAEELERLGREQRARVGYED